MAERKTSSGRAHLRTGDPLKTAYGNTGQYRAPSGRANGKVGNPAAAATPTPTKDVAAPTKPVAAVSVTPKKAKGSIGAASNKDLPGKTTITMAAGPKRDVAALRARSKASLADSKTAAASRGHGPGGGASTVLASLRKERKPTSREK